MNRVIPRTGPAMNGSARPSTLRGWAGFSLIEVIVATAVSSVILLIVYSAHRSIMTSIFDLTGVAEFHENVSLAVQRIDRDISYAYAQKFNERVCFIGENQMGQTANGRLDFITTDFSRESISLSPRKQNPTSDIYEVGYRLRPDREISGLYQLVRRRDLHYDDNPLDGGAEDAMLDNVTDLKFEFWLRNDWTDKWDSREAKKFPQAVRTTLRVKNYRGTVEDFVFISYVNPVNE